MLNKIFDKVCLFVFVVNCKATRITLKDSNSKPSFLNISYSNAKYTLIKLSSFKRLAIIKNMPLDCIISISY